MLTGLTVESHNVLTGASKRTECTCKHKSKLFTSHIQIALRQLWRTGTTSQGGIPLENPPQTTARNSQGLLPCSEVVTCTYVRNPGGHAEWNPRSSQEGVSCYIVLGRWTQKHRPRVVCEECPTRVCHSRASRQLAAIRYRRDAISQAFLTIACKDRSHAHAHSHYNGKTVSNA